MNPSLWKQFWKVTAKVLSFLYWSTAACLILGGATGALLLVGTFLFPFLPFIGPLFIVQAAGWFGRSGHTERKPEPVRAMSVAYLDADAR